EFNRSRTVGNGLSVVALRNVGGRAVAIGPGVTGIALDRDVEMLDSTIGIALFERLHALLIVNAGNIRLHAGLPGTGCHQDHEEYKRSEAIRINSTSDQAPTPCLIGLSPKATLPKSIGWINAGFSAAS